MEGLYYENPKMYNPLEGSKFLDYILYFLPMDYSIEVTLAWTNEEIQNGEGGKMTWGEFIRYMELSLLMATVAYGGDHRSYFSHYPINS